MEFDQFKVMYATTMLCYQTIEHDIIGRVGSIHTLIQSKLYKTSGKRAKMLVFSYI